MIKLESEPRVTPGPGFYASTFAWMRRAALALNPLADAIGEPRGGATSITQTLDGPAFKAYLGATSTGAPLNAMTQLTALSEQFDTASAYDTSNGRFTPKVEGYYLVSARIYLNGVGGNIINAQLHVQKNGAQEAVIAIDADGNFAQPWWQRSGSALIFMNGATDYLNLAYFCTKAAGTCSIIGDAAGTLTSWTAHLARRA